MTSAVDHAPEKISLNGEWNLGKVPVYALGKLDRYTRRTVSRLWHAMNQALNNPREQNVLRSQIRDLQSVIELVRPQWPQVADVASTSAWQEAAILTEALSTLNGAVGDLARSAEALLSQGGRRPEAETQVFGRKAIPAGAAPGGRNRDHAVAGLLRTIEAAMHTIFTVGKTIHEQGLQRVVTSEVFHPTAGAASAQSPDGLTFLGRKARTPRARVTANR